MKIAFKFFEIISILKYIKYDLFNQKIKSCAHHIVANMTLKLFLYWAYSILNSKRLMRFIFATIIFEIVSQINFIVYSCTQNMSEYVIVLESFILQERK